VGEGINWRVDGFKVERWIPANYREKNFRLGLDAPTEVNLYINTVQSANCFCELHRGARMRLWVQRGGGTDDFDDFLGSLGDDERVCVIMVLERLAENGNIENPEIFGALRNAVGMFKASFGGAELVFFRHDDGFFLCGYCRGRLSPETIVVAKWRQNEFFSSISASKHQNQNHL
jgi:hypothetical protein